MPLTVRLIPLLFSLLLLGFAPARAAEEDFPTWLAGLRAEAQADGIGPATGARPYGRAPLATTD